MQPLIFAERLPVLEASSDFISTGHQSHLPVIVMFAQRGPLLRFLVRLGQVAEREQSALPPDDALAWPHLRRLSIASKSTGNA